MPPFAQGLFDHHSTGVTSLGGFEVPRGSLSRHDTSFCRFVSQDAQKWRGSTIQERVVESSLGCRTVREVLPRGGILLRCRTARQVRGREFFRKNGGGPLHHLRRLFVVEVQSLPRNLVMPLRHPLVGQTPTPRERLLGISGLLRGFQRGFALPQEARVGNRDRLGVRAGDGGERLDAPVKRYRLDTPRALRLTDEDNRGLPTPVAVREVARVRLSSGACIPTHPYRADTRQPQTPMWQAIAWAESAIHRRAWESSTL